MNRDATAPIVQVMQGRSIEGDEGLERFERMARLVQRLLDLPVVSLDLLDPMRGPPVEPGDSPLLHWAGQQMRPSFIADASLHPALAADPCVRSAQGLRAVGCWPLMDVQRQRVGSLLVADRVPRELDGGEIELLGDLARCVEVEVATSRLARIDGLTGLSNRRGLEGAGAQLMALCRRHGQGLSLLSFDLDGFKSINDTYGHAEGDRVLIAFAEMLRACFRASDLIARLGGDEFVVLVPEPGSRIVEEVAERLQQEARSLRERLQTTYEIRFSVGCADFEPGRHTCMADLLHRGDAAMYVAKRARAKASAVEVNEQTVAADDQPLTRPALVGHSTPFS